jgi:hypothetical protein
VQPARELNFSLLGPDSTQLHPSINKDDRWKYPQKTR